MAAPSPPAVPETGLVGVPSVLSGGVDDEQLAEGPGIDVAQLAPLSEGDHHVGVLRLGVLDRLHPDQLAAHAEVDHQRVARVEGHQQILAQPAHRLDGPPLERGPEVLGRGVAAHGAPIGHGHRLDLLARHFARQVLTQRLDFG